MEFIEYLLVTLFKSNMSWHRTNVQRLEVRLRVPKVGCACRMSQLSNKHTRVLCRATASCAATLVSISKDKEEEVESLQSRRPL